MGRTTWRDIYIYPVLDLFIWNGACILNKIVRHAVIIVLCILLVSNMLLCMGSIPCVSCNWIERFSHTCWLLVHTLGGGGGGGGGQVGSL